MSQSQQNQFVVKDSGKRIDYPTGARRDTDEGKPRYDLIPHQMLTRLAHHLRKGAEKYGDRNWEKGIPTWRLIASGLRHVYAYLGGDRSEDHLSAIIFNFGAIVYFEEIGGNPADPSNTDVVVPPEKPSSPARATYIPAGWRVFHTGGDMDWVWNGRTSYYAHAGTLDRYTGVGGAESSFTLEDALSMSHFKERFA